MLNATNSTQNSQLPPLEWTLTKTGLSILFSSIVICTIVGNFLVLLAFVRYRKILRQPTHYFLANLALADFLVGVFSLPYLAVRTITFRWYFGPQFCNAWTIMHFTFCACSILSTLAVCVERFVGVRYPLKHLKIMHTKRIITMLIGTWALAGILSAVPIYVWPETPSTKPLDCKINFRPGHVIVASFGIFYTPATAMIILYYMIYRSATSQEVKALRRIESTDSAILEKKVEQNKQNRLAKKLAFLVGFLILSYAPLFTILPIVAFTSIYVPPKVFFTIAWFRYFNSCINPVIYAFSVPGYKKVFKNMFPFCVKDQNKISSSSSFKTNSFRLKSFK